MNGTVITIGIRHTKEGKTNIHNDDDNDDKILMTDWLNSLMVNYKDNISTKMQVQEIKTKGRAGHKEENKKCQGMKIHLE
jgi:hypothetical protein